MIDIFIDCDNKKVIQMKNEIEAEQHLSRITDENSHLAKWELNLCQDVLVDDKGISSGKTNGFFMDCYGGIDNLGETHKNIFIGNVLIIQKVKNIIENEFYTRDELANQIIFVSFDEPPLKQIEKQLML